MDVPLLQGGAPHSIPDLYETIAGLVNQAQVNASPLPFLLDDEIELSTAVNESSIQDSASVRNVLRARKIALFLIDDRGEIESQRLSQVIEILRSGLYSLSPDHAQDMVRDQHMLRILELLQNDKEYIRQFRLISRPFSNRVAETLIRDTLLLGPAQSIGDAEVRRAVLAVSLTSIRQSLGSCFATAPAILIHQEQPLLFLQDLDEMLSTGRLRRTFGGMEYTVPLCQSSGNGDLKKPFVMTMDFHEAVKYKPWLSPAIIQALQAVDLLEKHDLKKSSSLVKKLLHKALPLLHKKGELFATSSEELLRAILLEHHHLTLLDLQEFSARPKEMARTGLVVEVPRHTRRLSKANKTNACMAFLRDFEIAKTAFKSVAELALLKSWEFTIASFSEIKADFARFNFYASIGINADDPGGIGEFLYKTISGKVEAANLYLQERTEEYNGILAQMHFLEGRVQQAATEREVDWLKVEYRSRQTELYHIEELRNVAYEKTKKIAKLHEFLIQSYVDKFASYFQEVYDPDIHDITEGLFDDSPAGFRLLYKHGRDNPALWTRIYTPQEFIDSLVSFFTVTEQELLIESELHSIETEVSQIVTSLVNFVRSEAFLESAFYRMGKAHGVGVPEYPLLNLDRIEKKPWVYTSGGSMNTLISAYFKLSHKPTEISRWVESEVELLAFLLETVRQLPPKVLEYYREGSDRSLLMHSPTHAFRLQPAFQIFKDGWESDLYVYSWIKHLFMEPEQFFIDDQLVNEDMAKEVAHAFREYIAPTGHKRYDDLSYQVPALMSIQRFRREFTSLILSDKRLLQACHGILPTPDDIDECIYELFPFSSQEVVKLALQEILQKLCGNKRELLARYESVFEKLWAHIKHTEYFSAKKTLELLKTCVIALFGKTRFQINLQETLIQELRTRKLLWNAPLIFADSNWVRDYFAFVFSPASGQLELWSVNIFGTKGRPISSWKMWVNGSRRDPQWGILNKPFEYRGV